MAWRIEDKNSGKGFNHNGSFASAIDTARKLCSEAWHCFTIWTPLPENRKIAEVRMQGEPTWIAEDYRFLMK